MRHVTDWRKGQPVEEALQERLRQLIKKHSAQVVAEAIGISKLAVVCAAAGDGVRPGTAYIIEQKIALLESKAA